MRLQDAWNGLMRENMALKGALFVTSVIAMLMGIMALKFSNNDPLVIDRSPLSKVAHIGSEELTLTELEQFVRESLAQRFNTEARDFYYLSDLQKIARDKEQSELLRNQMRQFLYVETITDDKSLISVEATRLILVGSIRSAFNFPLALKIEKIGRTDSNPYGLVLTEVKNLKPDGKESNEK